MAIRLPNNSHRITILGRTGTGKTVAGLWHLSNHDLSRPWIIFDFKDDEHINSIENARHVELGYVPTKRDSGLFIVHPDIEDTNRTVKEVSPVENYLNKIWERKNCGIMCDEAFMMGSNQGFVKNLIQGRSRRTPMICCSQRPVSVSRFCFSEADFIQAFHLNDERDRDTVTQFTPLDISNFDNLDRFQSYYYDVGENELVKLAPVPPMKKILEKFDVMLDRRLVAI